MKRITCVIIAACVIWGMGVAYGADGAPPVIVKSKSKPERPWKDYPTRTIDTLAGFTPAAAPPKLDKYGGLADRKADATGFFHAKKIAERWWLIDPAGGLFIHVGVAAVNTGQSDAEKAAFKAKFGTPETWACQTTDLLHGAGFNGAGAWSAGATLRTAPQPLVYTLIWDFMSKFGKSKGLTHVASGHAGYVNDCIPVFHPDFEAWCDQHAASLDATKDDPYLLGHFSDNELPHPKIEKYLSLDPKETEMASSRQAAIDWLAQRKGPGATAKSLTDDDREAFTQFAWERYHRIVTGAIRKHDPHHLCLGSRYHGGDKHSAAAFKAGGKYLDVIAFNYYSEWGPTPTTLKEWEQWSSRPCIITEFYVKGADSGYANTTGAGWIVPTQKDRALFYQHFTLGLLESRSCVGWHWFKYQDNDPKNLKTDPSNRDSNKGIVNTQFQVYQPLLDGMQPLNRQVYPVIDFFDRK